MDVVPYDELHKYTSHPIEKLISPEEYKKVVSNSDVVRYYNFIIALRAGANRYALEGLGFFLPTTEDMLNANLIKEVMDFLPELEESRRLACMFSQALFRH